MALDEHTARTRPTRTRVMIFDVQPSVDGGRYPVKRVVGDRVSVGCDLVSDGHDVVRGVVWYQALSDGWSQVELIARGNDHFGAEFEANGVGRCRFLVEGWIDEFATWRHGLLRKHEAGQEVTLELQAGVALIRAAAERASDDEKSQLEAFGMLLEQGELEARFRSAMSEELRTMMALHPDRRFSSKSSTYEIVVDPMRARYSSWYELFPRSFGKNGQHGTFADMERLLPYVASMGFDVLYLPPIHPIGTTFRKGPNNALEAAPGDPGSPWAIGAKEGGHKEIHPQLGTTSDFERFVNEARNLGIEVALDIAFQASPDHPYVQAHPEWFVHRPDGTIQYAENPPKKYQDVYPFDLSGPACDRLWPELKSVFDVWIERGVRVFRVDNPHTKPLSFWEYCISEVKAEHPDIVFLSEAFTRPKVMYALAKVGFSQSYTYFTWRTTSTDLRAYLEELTQPSVSDFFRPNFWPNTPDILPEHLQFGGRGMFLSRMILAATLSASWGIYGPAFELMESVARPGSEEYLDNEKFQLRTWDLERPDSLRTAIRRINAIRRENTALQRNDTLVFHATDNPNVLAYSKTCPGSGNVVLVVVNLEPSHRHSAWLDLDLRALLVGSDEVYQVHDLISDARFQWHGPRTYVELDPVTMPAHVFRIRRRVRSERSFEYYL